jgi:hypothetical protein
MGRGRFRLGRRRLLVIWRRLGMKSRAFIRQEELKGMKE